MSAAVLIVAVVFFGDKLTAYVDADFINRLIIDLLHMEAVVDYVGVVEYFGSYQHH